MTTLRPVSTQERSEISSIEKESIIEDLKKNLEGFEGPFRSIKDIIADLSKPIADRHIHHIQRGGQQIPFIPWHLAVKYLDLYAPAWSYEIRTVTHAANNVVVVARITIRCKEGVVWREATGIEDDNQDRYGDPTSNAESMALRRAAAKFGLALYLYDR
jgi:hypothetical protein